MSILHNIYFHSSSKILDTLPQDELPEVCFVGRSNVGKSTAINKITNKKKLAFSSKTPGRTRLINMFNIVEQKNHKTIGYLVDLPGYGYANLSNQEKIDFEKNLTKYVQYRKSLVGIILLIDMRRGITSLDNDFLNLVNSKPITIMLTKADKLNHTERLIIRKTTTEKLIKFKNITDIVEFSATKRIGISEVSDIINKLIT
ncbi:ribosome biogenesis GTP-binding protein YihA/YsxC [Candidatus Kinetoplastidibacterium galati]|uniref:Probable GTP-binding protein EngB n=1 Tax=Candidatus Kinetoplastidibacterium galati TCC219 TaxID=1208921 RepID=M1MC73_9PROT|nr:ribosome biogenesis GTP-binding protein YihA/YsxC [Candidatus Kinetoplastibacterium galatii]AGF49405.1 GTP-binding protein [Candidatus Kinetoplastibacterium galatii TCC219]